MHGLKSPKKSGGRSKAKLDAARKDFQSGASRAELAEAAATATLAAFENLNPFQRARCFKKCILAILVAAHLYFSRCAMRKRARA